MITLEEFKKIEEEYFDMRKKYIEVQQRYEEAKRETYKPQVYEWVLNNGINEEYFIRVPNEKMKELWRFLFNLDNNLMGIIGPKKVKNGLNALKIEHKWEQTEAGTIDLLVNNKFLQKSVS